MSDELTAAYAELSRRQSFTDALLETVDVGIVSCDADGHFVVSNRAQRAIFGFQSELRGLWMGEIEPHIDVFDTDGTRLSPEQYPLMRALRGGAVTAENVLVGPAGGPWREIVVRATQIIGPDGAILGAVAALTDVSAERETARALMQERQRLHEAQRIGQLGSFEHDFVTGGWTYSAHLATMWGLEASTMDVHTRAALILAEDQGHAAASWDAACRQGGHHSYEYRIARASDGVERLLRTDLEIDFGGQGRPVMARGTQLDVTELKTAEQAATTARAFFDAVLTASPDYTFVTEVSSGALIYGSRDKHVLGITTAQLTALGDRAIEILVHPEDRAHLRANDVGAADLDDGNVLQIRYRGMHVDGIWRWLNRRSTPFRRDASGRVVEVLAVVRDITDVVDAELQLTHAAEHDHLTGLPNRPALLQRLEAALMQSLRSGKEVAVLFIDLDGFKLVNDTAGHAAGDAVLHETALRLQGALRDGDTVARVGGDEFVIVIGPWRDRRTLSRSAVRSGAPMGDDLAVGVAERALARCRRPVTVEGVDHVITASIGVAHLTDLPTSIESPVTAESLLRAADAAMYVAKSRGKNRIYVYEP